MGASISIKNLSQQTDAYDNYESDDFTFKCHIYFNREKPYKKDIRI